MGHTGHSRENTVSTPELEFGIVELGKILIRDLGIILLGKVTDSSSWWESHEWLGDLRHDLFLTVLAWSGSDNRGWAYLEILPIWAICSTLELDDGFLGESELGSVNNLTGRLVALDILALVVEGESLGLLHQSALSFRQHVVCDLHRLSHAWHFRPLHHRPLTSFYHYHALGLGGFHLEHRQS
jgi:hypothetical protein